MSAHKEDSWIQEICRKWSGNLPLSTGGFAESAGPGWTEGPETERTMLTQARLAYTFTHAGILGGGDGDLARTGREAGVRMMDLYWNPGLRGWIRSCDKEGRPLDETVDTYDQAFGLLALAWSYKAPGDSAARAAAVLALKGLEKSSGDSSFGGFRELRNGSRASRMVAYPGFRRQNPHMHLLEAFLAWHSADPSGPWLDRARAMVELFRTHFRHPSSGNLSEYFNDEWKLAKGAAGKVREPGHQHEWVWLLRRYEETSGDASVRQDAEHLYRFALTRGTDLDRLAFAEIDDDGNIPDMRKLLWPQTETLKAHIAMYEWTGNASAKESAVKVFEAIRKRFMTGDGALFFNLLDKDGKPDPAPALSRLLYHLFVAAAEAERVFEPLSDS